MGKQTSEKTDKIIMGDEPVLSGPITRMQLAEALNWYNYFYSPSIGSPRPSMCVDWILDYMKNNGYSAAEIAKFKKVSNKDIPTTMCSMARLLNNGAEFENDLDARIRHFVKHYMEPVENSEAPVKRPNPIIAEYDDMLDAFFNADYKYLPELPTEVKGTREEINAAVSYYNDLLQELKGGQEGYEHITRAAFKRYVTLVEEILGALAEKKVRKFTKPRKPRAPKKKTNEQLVAKLQYLPALKIGDSVIESVHPSKLVESVVVWTYHSRKRLLTKYVSTNGPIIVHRTTLKGFDEKQSFAKKIRKPEIIKQIATEGKAAISKIFDKIKAKPQAVSGRMNDETLIVRTFK